ncbi:putative O-Glycosyl hydrolase family 30 [Paratrimastix pyriformis]|uniref:O-Glycosyl hydrolase family 30 n=1 Tax=Paratrimastix pyriformis TaxID=342808 RepID=A0ABQ8UEG7_9EUKA|nr:putative O-Glycosyl hydrolase family 30 [Paratrimastix pyriformis]
MMGKKLILLATLLVAVCSAMNVRLIQSARDTGDRFATMPSPKWVPDTTAARTLTINVDKKYQALLGFGGAFTEAAAHNFAQMSPAKQAELLEAYFGPSGNQYTVGRIHMNSCDFSINGSYSYDDTRDDFALTHFDISHDLNEIIPFIQRALNTTYNPMSLYFSPWSPPAWMKKNENMISSPTPGLKADSRYHAAWALFFSKFIDAYAAQGINFWGLTVQNEPGFADTCPWESCGYHGEDERDFVRDFLGPQLKQDHPDVKIMIFDHNKDNVATFSQKILADPKAAQYVAGTAFHWYSGDQFENLDLVHDMDSSKFLLATEACECPPAIGDWHRGEMYGHDILGDLNHWATGWVDWNLILDMKGGPNHVKNFCGAPIHVDPLTDTIHYEAPYFYMGHFSRYLFPGTVRVGLDMGASGSPLEAAAFMGASGVQVIVVVMNPSEAAVQYKINDPVNAPGMALVNTIPAHGIQTVTYTLRC